MKGGKTFFFGRKSLKIFPNIEVENIISVQDSRFLWKS
jgi:hypothetical protein